MNSRLPTIAGLLTMLLPLPLAAAVPVRVTQYQPDESVFPNPERGFYHHTELHQLDSSIGRIRDDGDTLVWGQISLQPYKNSPTLPQDFLGKIGRAFQIAREQGVKIIVRASYGDRGASGDYRSFQDAPPQHIRNHIDQLAPILAGNADVIALFEAGFIGPWGEWHTTTIAEDYDQSREMLFYILDHTPKDRMVVVRYPYLKQQIFQKPDGGFETVAAGNAYSGQRVARVGHHNDCFLSSADDVGTYDRGGGDRRQETAYLAAETLYTPFGGETCRPYELSDCPRTLQEMQTLHAAYLNRGYHPQVLREWREQGCFEEISKRLGARLVLTQSRISGYAAPGGTHTITVEVDLQNVGFASLYNPRLVQIVLEHRPSGQTFPFEVNVDPRCWKAGASHTLRRDIPHTDALPAGDYAAYLNLPDPYPTLEKDPRYSFRLANQGVWDPQRGYNKLLAEGIAIAASRPAGPAQTLPP